MSSPESWDAVVTACEREEIIGVKVLMERDGCDFRGTLETASGVYEYRFTVVQDGGPGTSEELDFCRAVYVLTVTGPGGFLVSMDNWLDPDFTLDCCCGPKGIVSFDLGSAAIVEAARCCLPLYLHIRTDFCPNVHFPGHFGCLNCESLPGRPAWSWIVRRTNGDLEYRDAGCGSGELNYDSFCSFSSAVIARDPANPTRLRLTLTSSFGVIWSGTKTGGCGLWPAGRYDRDTECEQGDIPDGYYQMPQLYAVEVCPEMTCVHDECMPCGGCGEASGWSDDSYVAAPRTVKLFFGGASQGARGADCCSGEATTYGPCGVPTACDEGELKVCEYTAQNFHETIIGLPRKRTGGGCVWQEEGANFAVDRATLASALCDQEGCPELIAWTEQYNARVGLASRRWQVFIDPIESGPPAYFGETEPVDSCCQGGGGQIFIGVNTQTCEPVYLTFYVEPEAPSP